MRKTGQIPEYVRWNVPGTFNSTEVKNPLCGQMMTIEDLVIADDQIIVYRQLSDGTQIDPIGDPIVVTFDTVDFKQKNHTIVSDPTQTNFTTQNPRWVITIDIGTILRNLLFALLKNYRSFEGIFPEDTSETDVNLFLKDYIEENIIKQLDLDHINFYVKYIKNTKTIPDYKWALNITYPHLLQTNYSSLYDNKTEVLTIGYTQSSDISFSMNYYFNIFWKRI